MTDLIAYERLVEKALLSVVHDALEIAEKEGLPGNNHFYITFKTHYNGVIISSRLLEAYPEEMTIVLQHEFSDLKVEDKAFSVTLSFGNIPERITIPFAAILSFADPHAQFAISFQVDLEKAAEDIGKKKKTPASKKLSEKTQNNSEKEENSEQEENNVVSLSAFRKKN